MHLAAGSYTAHMTDPSASDNPFVAVPAGITYAGMFYEYDSATDQYVNGQSRVTFGPGPGHVYVSTNPNTGGTYAAAP